MWSVRTLNRNIGTQYYGRRMASVREGLALPSPDIEANDPLEYIKSPVVAEFLGFRKDSKYDENQLEQALIDHLQQFIMELGRGFAFVDRQKHISTDTGDFYIDLVFYNIKLKRYVLFELHKVDYSVYCIEIARSIARASFDLVLQEIDIQSPMHAFDGPMLAYDVARPRSVRRQVRHIQTFLKGTLSC